MSTTYNTVVGDTFENIARKKYGDENLANHIATANPGVSEPLSAGISLIIPIAPGTPQNALSQAPATNSDEVAVLIDGQRFRFWDKVRITRASDNMDTVEFGAPFDYSAPGFRETFKPFSFKPVTITVGGDPLFTGTAIAINPVVENNQKIVAISGYSLPGVLNDCTPPASSFPLEFNDQKLDEIAATMVAPFGISIDFQADPGAVFDRVACEPGKRVLAFLTELAKQRNLILTSSPRGKLIFWKSTTNQKPVARLEQGSTPVLSVSPTFNPQEYYSHITGIEPVVVGLPGSQFTVKNSHLSSVLRPMSFNVTDTKDADLKTAVEAKAGRMFANMVSYVVNVATWRDPSGELWTPNTLVELIAPDAMVYNSYKFEIRTVEFNRDRSTETATLNLIIPGTFDGKLPEVLPWDD